MDAVDQQRRQTEALIEAIWGAAAPAPVPEDLPARRRQNAELGDALRAYLQLYFEEVSA